MKPMCRRKVRALRKQNDLSLRQLASEIELATHSHLDRIEKGESYPSAELILKIADFFDVSIDLLMRDHVELD